MTDRRVFLAVVAILGTTLIVSVVAIAGLAGADRPSPGILDQVVVGCLTGLAGLLARGPSSEPQEVVVRQPPGDPVPVDDRGHVDLTAVIVGVIVGVILLVVVLVLVGRL